MKLLLFFYLITLVDSLKLNKFCINCKYSVPDKDGKPEYAKCSKFPIENAKFLVTGNVIDKDFYYCSTARNFFSMCGKNATKYKKKM